MLIAQLTVKTQQIRYISSNYSLQITATYIFMQVTELTPLNKHHKILRATLSVTQTNIIQENTVSYWHDPIFIL